MIRWLTIALSILAFAASTASSGDIEWQDLCSTRAGLRIQLPGVAEYERSSQLTLGGWVIQHHYWVEVPGARLDIERMDLPRVATFFMSPSRLLDTARDDLMSELGTRPDLEESLLLQGVPGRRLEFRRGQGAAVEAEEVWLLLADRHLYIVSAGPYVAEARVPIVDRVFASFRIVLDETGECLDAVETRDDQGSSDQRS